MHPKSMIGGLFGLAMMAALVPATAIEPAFAQQVPSSRQDIQLSFASVVKQAAPAVVNIYTQKTVRARALPPIFNDPLFRQFFGNRLPQGVPQKRVENSLGSGVIIQPNGIIVTNNHVIEGADQITVVLQDRREFEADLVGSDERTDLAVLRLKDSPRDLPTLQLGSMDSLEVGDLVLAIGNPFGVGQTVTSGIVSALGRHTGGASFNAFIQTDAAINPGNSGGALVTMDGRLAGINSSIYTRDGGYMGIGFAIPSDMVRTVTAGLLDGGKVVRAWVGITGQPVGRDIAASLGFDRPGGILINGIAKDSPAERAGLKIGDVVTAIDGAEVADPADLRYRLATRPVGGSSELSVLRKGGAVTLSMPLQAPPDVPARDEIEIKGRTPLTGIKAANLNPALSEELERPYTENTVVVTAVLRDGYAATLGVEPGDIVREINGTPIRRTSDLMPLLKNTPSRWLIVIQRGDRLLNLRVG